MVASTSPANLNGSPPPGEWSAHIGHHFHPHRHTTVGKDKRKCSGRWYCERDKTWISGLKCEEAK